MFNPYDYYITPEEYEEAARNGLTRQHVNDRIRKLGWEKQKAITLELQKTFTDRTVIYALAKAHGITNKMVRKRLSLGWSDMKAATAPPEDIESRNERARHMGLRKRKVPIEILDLALNNGISNHLYRVRIRRGWDLSLASTIPPSPHNAAMILRKKYGDNHFKDLNNRFWARGRKRK